jgi:hypothetical protein
VTGPAVTDVAALAERVEQLEAQIQDLARDVFSPKEIARRFRIDHAAVYAACETGLLVAEERPISKGRTGYLITLDDARRWYAKTRKTNQ